MNRAWDLIARAVTWFVWVPVDRTVCRVCHRTHTQPRRAS